MRLLKIKKLKKINSTTEQELESLLKIAKSKRITEEEEKRLICEINKDSANAINKLVDSWEYGIVKIAFRYRNEKFPTPILIEQGRKGLFAFLSSFKDDTKPENIYKKLQSFGVWAIQQSMLRYIQSSNNNE